MAREGTRSSTGNSKPRVFQTVDTAPAVKRTTKPKAAKEETKGAKPTGVTKKKAAPKKETVAKKVCRLRLRLCGGHIRHNRANSLTFRPRLLSRRPRPRRQPRRPRRRRRPTSPRRLKRPRRLRRSRKLRR
ncbi:uncharacterized protein PODANS_4_7860 [Podospora anserina S mat+]|uniref:Podospora anserina S mat+ genomic DNA chromosome 4, supercontig 4 n=1 Tax=Podospora anserina (strain S / ATCC MYA-4624 / DSM 980 / FGSC 10383) TaxID=515849 RepID=B2ARD5_PODAN|nr:uncharacterized protein PODANS_4_7860 [Podospora anserina S mat+]CAP66713.1 unnamed protein product [Podospora anserina S mat+]CDP28448.1 Putative protein of unknown function [Podospora anserina S mat+]